MYNRLCTAVSCVRKITDFQPEIALVLGSGLGSFANDIKKVAIIKYSDIDCFPVSTVEGHSGQFVFGYLGGVKVVAMQGRVHYYEGYKMEDVVLPIRLMGMLGAKTLFLTNAAGGINTNFSEGTLMSITDHIMLAPNPLVGKNIAEIGDRFPDMSEIYDGDCRRILKEAADELEITIQSGVYIQVTGPSFETPAEIRAYRTWGADAVGMSTACEAVAARHMGMKVLGVSCITNMAAGMNSQALAHLDVQVVADRVRGQFTKLIERSIVKIKEKK